MYNLVIIITYNLMLARNYNDDVIEKNDGGLIIKLKNKLEKKQQFIKKRSCCSS